MIPFDSRGAFKPVNEHSELRRLAMRGAAVTVSASGLMLAIQIVSTVVLARLLTPGDFGLVTMVTTFSLLLMSFGQNGFLEAVIQREQMNRDLASNLFWIAAGIGLLMTVAFAAAGSLLARFFRNPLVDHVAVATSVSILLSALSVIHLGLLKRALRFTAVSVNDVVGRTVYTVAMIVLAWAGWGYWALVAGIIAYGFCTTIGAWWLCPWVPGVPRRAPGTAAMARFALHIYGRFSLNYFTRNFDNLLLGWRFNADALGLYKKAYDLFALSESQLTGPLHNVALATLSRLTGDPARFKRYMRKALAILAFAGMGIGAALTLTGRDIIRLALGPKWDGAGRIFVLFGPGIGIMLLRSASGWIHLALGYANRWLRWTAVESAVTGGMFIAALHWGPSGIAAAWSLSLWILTIPAFWYAGRPIRMTASSLLGPTWKFTFASLAAACACWLVVRANAKLSALAVAHSAGAAFEGIVIISGLFACLYVAAVAVLYQGRAPLREVADIVRDLVPCDTIAPGQESAASKYWLKARAHLALEGTRLLCRRPFTIETEVPIISFTFDDFPRSAFWEGGRILAKYGARGTYYVSLGLMGKHGPHGALFVLEDLEALAEEGHELGCHTFGHLHSLVSSPAEFEESIIRNREALAELLPGASFRTFAYPISIPWPNTKRRTSRHFLCCRGSGQTFNAGVADLNYLSAFFLERSHDNPDIIREVIDEAVRARGWLILSTHDISDVPSSCGCTPGFFEDVVRYAVESGARILPVVQAWEALTGQCLSKLAEGTLTAQAR